METLQELVDVINKSGKRIIVEGRKDLRALRVIGVSNGIETLNGRPLFQVSEELAEHKELIILTDLDREGRKLYGRLSTYLQSQGCTIDNRFREFLLKKTKLRQIEGIDTYFRRS